MTKYAKTTRLGKTKKYHTNEDCWCLERANNYREVSEQEINQWGLTLCKHCEGYNHKTYGPNTASKLRNIDAKEVL